MRDLTNSKIDRQNILNNDLAIIEIRKETKMYGYKFEGALYLTKEMLSRFFGVDLRTIEKYTSDYQSELRDSGYELLTGKRLKDFMNNACIDDPDIDVGMIDKKTAGLAVYSFRAFLNLAMLLTDSESAKLLRLKMLDIVMDLINQKTGGATKYINRRDPDFHDENYHKEFTEDYVRPLEKAESERFLGADSDEVKRLMDENADVFKRLKERE